MDTEFWHGKWQQNEIGFHQSEINQHLMKHWATLAIPEGATVFVPLCGKSLDLLWLLDKGYRVIGVELSPIAVEDFFNENGIAFEVSEEGPFYVYRHDELTIYMGDFFDLTREQLDDVEVIYDRAALVALPAEMRERYAEHLCKMAPDNEDVLLVTMEYEQAEMSGPPFSVSETEVHDLFANKYDIHSLERFDVLEHMPRFKERGISSLNECIYHMNIKSS
ncbi:MAG: thiopurine S-methyltransferase [Gammaproteobacteria bacterium]|nr:thiopurine S-methyltransferase [Gammaproteobacteria bacterium]